MRLRFAAPCVVAACTSLSPPATTAGTCTPPLSCSGPECQLATAETDGSLCPAFEQHYGDYTIITQQGTDTETALYYDATGNLAASVHTEPSGKSDCAGSAAFTAEACQTPTTMLAVCGAQP